MRRMIATGETPLGFQVFWQEGGRCFIHHKAGTRDAAIELWLKVCERAAQGEVTIYELESSPRWTAIDCSRFPEVSHE